MKKILKIFSITTFSNLLYGLYQWILLIILLKWGSVEEAGLYTFGLSVTAPFIMLLSLKYENYIPARRLEKIDLYSMYSFRIVLLVIGSSIFLPVVFLIYGNTQYFLVLLGVWVFKCIQSLIDFNYVVLIHYNKIPYLNTRKIKRAFISVLITLIVYGLTTNLVLLLFSLCIYMLLEWWTLYRYFRMINISFPAFYEIKFSFINKENINKYLVLFIPFGMSLFLISINANISRIFGEKYFGIEFVGVFTSLVYFITIGNLVINTSFSVISFKLKESLEKSPKKFVDIYTKMNIFVLLVGITGIFAAFLLGDKFLIFIYNSSYENKETEFILVMLTGMFLYFSTFYQYMLTMLNHLTVQFHVIFISLVVQVILISLLKNYGEISIYIAYGGSLAVTSLTFYIILKKKLLYRMRRQELLNEAKS